MIENVMVFVDAQDMYRTARHAFFSTNASSIDGNFYPDLLRLEVANGRNLAQVRLYDGLPSSSRNPKGYSAHMRRVGAWKNAGVEVITRPLRYLNDGTISQKGVDVLIAIDIVTLAIDSQYDTAILASMDTDLIPPLEYVSRSLKLAKTVEVVAWKGGTQQSRIRLKGPHIKCHWLDSVAYGRIADTTRYTV